MASIIDPPAGSIPARRSAKSATQDSTVQHAGEGLDHRLLRASPIRLIPGGELGHRHNLSGGAVNVGSGLICARRIKDPFVLNSRDRVLFREKVYSSVKPEPAPAAIQAQQTLSVIPV